MTITEAHTALMAFYSSFGVPAFVRGNVPDGQPLPYITFDVSIGDTFGEGMLTAFNWHRWAEETGIGVAMAERAELMDKIAEAVHPMGGIKVPCKSGFLMLYRKDADFQTYYDDPTDKHIIGGRTAFDVHFNVR